MNDSIWHRLKPGVPQTTLFLIAGIAWTTAGGILLGRGLAGLIPIGTWLWARLLIGLVLGILFYIFLFYRISARNIKHIHLIKISNPCAFSFFNIRSWIMMTLMISMGITLRKLNVINPGYMFTFYVVMGIPLLVSAFNFYAEWIKKLRKR
jgi:hypothetical protein